MKTLPLAAYGFLGMPLAMVALPVYVQAPAWYAGHLGLALPVTGFVLFAARIFDTVQDPWLGRMIDVMARKNALGLALWLAAIVLALAFTGLWLPPIAGSTPALAGWLALMLALIYSAHSVLNITLLAWGARMTPDLPTLTRAAAWREASGLAGVVLASVLPVWLMTAAPWPPAQSMAVFAGGFALLLIMGLILLLHFAPLWPIRAGVPPARVRASPAVRRLWLPYLVNALSIAIPATLALFFIADRIIKPQWAGLFLAVYFLSGAAGLPVWTRLAQRIGPARAWGCSMVLATSTYVWTIFLGAGDVLAYGAVCLLAGLALGADLALPPVLLARAIPPDADPAAHYGVWSLLAKLATAISGLALPLLAWLGYRPGVAGSGGSALGLVYGALPGVLKLLAFAILYFQVIAKEEQPA
ncbi:MFS transporter [Silvimonas soli]|uniref:MFS transporter n=1 Tax=Silvimonas soli TaxID=2980100 RepID=UPI0024B385F7|nr:MFS transporter [Silvimonas soli]